MKKSILILQTLTISPIIALFVFTGLEFCSAYKRYYVDYLIKLGSL